MSAFGHQLFRELRLVARSAADAGNPLVFLFLGLTLFALSAGGEPQVLAALAPGAVWVLVLLANMLSLDGMFRRDYDDGTLEQMLLLGEPAFLPLLAKVLAQWCVSGLAMTLLAPMAAMILFLPVEGVPVLMLTLLVGSPALSLLGAVGAALTVGLRRGGVLLGLLVLPLYVPILIFAVAAVEQQLAGMAIAAQISWLGAITMLSLTVAPFATLAALRISIQE